RLYDTSTTLVSRLTTLFFLPTHSPTSELYTLSLHDALPISLTIIADHFPIISPVTTRGDISKAMCIMTFNHILLVSILIVHSIKDRKSTRLNSSHVSISYAVFCLKKKKKT